MASHPPEPDPAAAPRWLDADQQAAWRSYLRGHTLLLAELGRRLQETSGLSITEFEVLVNLSEAPDRVLRSHRLADAMQWERSRLTHQLTRMEKRGLIERVPCETDGRGSDVHLTADGADLLARAAAPHAAEVQDLFVGPVGDALAVFGAALARIEDALRAE